MWSIRKMVMTGAAVIAAGAAWTFARGVQPNPKWPFRRHFKDRKKN